MRTVSLVFEYDFEKAKRDGRYWVEEAYKSKDFIFDYTAASFAMFLHHNPKRIHIVDTDDVDLLYGKMKKYNVNLSNLVIRDSKELIQEWKSYDYCFFPMHYHLKYVAENCNESLVKIDNDLTWHKSIDDLENFDGALVWQFERNVAEGRLYWGESYACTHALGTANFNEYNTGVLGISKDNLDMPNEFIEITKKLIAVDVSPATRTAPPNKSEHWNIKTYSTSAQTAENWVFHKRNLSITETHDYCYHHIDGITAKAKCIDNAEFLLK